MNSHESEISLRDFAERDISSLADYWYRSPAGFIEGLGVDISKVPSEEKFCEGYRALIERCRTEKTPTMPILVVEYLEKPIGVHLVNSISPGDKATFHAHFWLKECRGRGFALYSYVKAFAIFFERFSLQTLHLKTPVQNQAANRVHEKLGIPVIEKVELNGTILHDGTLANHRILTRVDLKRLGVKV